MKAINVSVRRPEQNRKRDADIMWREALVLSESIDDATRKTIAHFNDIDGVEDYYVSSIHISASTEEGEGGVLLV